MKIICIGRNYADHVLELGNEIPDIDYRSIGAILGLSEKTSLPHLQ